MLEWVRAGEVGGTLGAPERTDPPSTRAATLTSLLDALTAARSVVVFTGAGVSTAAGIPDFRGPDGVWTLLQSTNVALPFSQWQTNCIATCDGAGILSLNLPNSATNPIEFYILK